MIDIAPITFVAIVAVILAPVILDLRTHRRIGSANSRGLFLVNTGGNGLIATIAGAVAGNIGIGSFLAIFLFGTVSPIIAFSIVGAYTLGLFLCAYLAPAMRKAADANGTVGLVDLIARSHRVRVLGLIWIPVAVVFVLRSAVQLGALGFITASILDISATTAIVGFSVFIGVYLVIGGYRAAVQTDMAQAIIIVVSGIICLAGIGRLDGAPPAFFSFGDYEPVLLVGIWLFIPWSAVLAVDNWQRINVASSTGTARSGYIAAAFICGVLFTLMALAGYFAPAGATMYDTFQLLVPDAFAWVPVIMFVACITSSIDTFIMPLVSVMGPSVSFAKIRLTIVALVTTTALTAILFGSFLDTIIAAFNSLAVFLPAAFGAVFLRDKSALAAVLSMNAGLAASIGLSLLDQSSASLFGFAIAAFTYGFGLFHARSCKSRSHPNE